MLEAFADLIDARDVFYIVTGAAFFGLTVLPLFGGLRYLSIPLLYVVAGAALTLSPFALPILDPQGSDLTRLIIEHASELIVIVALAGAGLAVDRAMTLKGCSHTWLLLAIAMPLTIGAIVWGSMAWVGLPLASAMLLAASVAPTDPVLARSVQVGGPNEGEEDDVRVTLTTEAGLNDGLAFPFIYLALAFAALAAGEADEGWWMSWLTVDVAYRVAAAVAVGWSVGKLYARFVHSRWGDAQQGADNAGLVMMSSTFLIYGLTEAVHGYGFLAVFIGARAGRHISRSETDDEYVAHPHRFSDQIENLLLALLLLWLGGYAVSGGLTGLTGSEVALAFAIIFIFRPLAGAVALWFARGSSLERFAMAAFGIRGMGSFFYLAYAAGAATFPELDAVWRITIVTVLLSILVHGTLAPFVMKKLHQQAVARGEMSRHAERRVS